MRRKRAGRSRSRRPLAMRAAFSPLLFPTTMVRGMRSAPSSSSRARLSRKPAWAPPSMPWRLRSIACWHASSSPAPGGGDDARHGQGRPVRAGVPRSGQTRHGPGQSTGPSPRPCRRTGHLGRGRATPPVEGGRARCPRRTGHRGPAPWGRRPACAEGRVQAALELARAAGQQGKAVPASTAGLGAGRGQVGQEAGGACLGGSPGGRGRRLALARTLVDGVAVQGQQFRRPSEAVKCGRSIVRRRCGGFHHQPGLRRASIGWPHEGPAGSLQPEDPGLEAVVYHERRALAPAGRRRSLRATPGEGPIVDRQQGHEQVGRAVTGAVGTAQQRTPGKPVVGLPGRFPGRGAPGISLEQREPHRARRHGDPGTPINEAGRCAGFDVVQHGKHVGSPRRSASLRSAQGQQDASRGVGSSRDDRIGVTPTPGCPGHAAPGSWHTCRAPPASPGPAPGHQARPRATRAGGEWPGRRAGGGPCGPRGSPAASLPFPRTTRGWEAVRCLRPTGQALARRSAGRGPREATPRRPPRPRRMGDSCHDRARDLLCCGFVHQAGHQGQAKLDGGAGSPRGDDLPVAHHLLPRRGLGKLAQGRRSARCTNARQAARRRPAR